MSKSSIDSIQTPDDIKAQLHHYAEIIIGTTQKLIEEKPEFNNAAGTQQASASIKLASIPPSSALANSHWHIESSKVAS